MGKIVKMSFEEKYLKEMGDGLKIYDSENNWAPGAGLLPTRGKNLHVYHHNIQRSSSL